MDIAKILETLAWFSRTFRRAEGRCLADHTARGTRYLTGFRFEKLMIILGVARGPRGGLIEELFAVDPAQKIEADRLRLYHAGRGVAICGMSGSRSMRCGLKSAPARHSSRWHNGISNPL